jgi:thioredoxin 1
MTMTLELTQANFQREVLEADVPVLVDFWAPRCGPCKMIAPTIDRLAETAGGRYRIGKVNAEEEADLSTLYRVSALPTLVFFKGGWEVGRLVGAQREDTLARALEEVA